MVPRASLVTRWLKKKKKNLPAWAGDMGSIPGSGKIPWRRNWQPTPVFLSGKSHGQRSLTGYNPWGHKRIRQNLVAKQQQCLVAQSCPILCVCVCVCVLFIIYLFILHPMDCSLPSSSVHSDSPGKNTGVGCHSLLQGSSQPRD